MIANKAANKDVAGLPKARGLGPTNEVYQMKATSSKPSKSKTNKEGNPQAEAKCKHCGKRNHSAEKCEFKHATCHKCNKQGHIAPVCKSLKQSQQGSCWILSIKFQEYSRSFQEPEIEFSRSLYKNISMPYIVFQCFLC